MTDKITMADECDVSKIVTVFLLNTCRLPPRPTKHDIQAAVVWGAIATQDPLCLGLIVYDEEAERIPLITGSVAEFYIKPMLPLVGDIDVMFHYNTLLLPAEFHNYVKVHEIIDSHLPGYVYLPLRYLLTQGIDDDKYEYFEYEIKKELVCLSHDAHGNNYAYSWTSCVYW